ncbi:MAG: NAD(P)-binding protein [Spirochaetes bacterium]|nr:NAD(P)-binding protein [Spirochaetota bacterium]
MMPKVLIVGAGLSGAAAARELAASGWQVLLAEESSAIGGKVRGYGCKAADKCANCGLCLAKNLWNDVEKNSLIDIRLNTKVLDVIGEKGNYTVALKNAGAVSYVNKISDVVIAVGFKGGTKADFNGFVEIQKADTAGSSIIMGSDIELLTKDRREAGLFDSPPGKIAFIQCFGSRDKKEHAMYCSRVCCAYSTRAAKLIKKYHPDCSITFFYMEMQQVKGGNYFDELKALGIDFIKCRPVKVKDGNPAIVTFDNPVTGRRQELAFDLVVLSDGIRPIDDAAKIAELCGLGQTEAGFLKYVKDINHADLTGVYVTGCAKGPAKIEEAYADSIAVARRVILGGR